jgi:DNA-binding NtrC family response regulator
MAMNVLLTFAGNRDPFNPELVQGAATDGPVLTLLRERSFETIYIFTTPNTLANAHSLRDEITRRLGQEQLKVDVLNLDIPDPTDYEALFIHMSGLCRKIVADHREAQPAYWIATASGTPQMQTVWFLLAQSGLIPATLLKITPPRFLRAGRKAVSEILLPLDFPKVALPDQDMLEMKAAYLRKEKLEAEHTDLVGEFSRYRMIGKSAAMSALTETIRAASRYDSAVLIQGETGTGKELVARAIHFNSPRKTEPFIVVNCAAIPETLVEGELFGHEKGAFTGALQQRKGKFELADGGTIFLDEIGDMPLPAQAKILRVLQDGEITRIGGAGPIKTDVRVIAATNRELAAFIAAGKFREDLYYRLKVIDIALPPLRKRREDIPLLIDFFLSRHNDRFRQRKQLSREALRRMLEHPWPGNIRELENAVERAFVLSKGSVIREADLPAEMLSSPVVAIALSESEPGTPAISDDASSFPRFLKRGQGGLSEGADIPIPPEGMNLDNALHDIEKASYEAAIKMKDGNREAAARLLGIKPHTFRKRAKEKFGL